MTQHEEQRAIEVREEYIATITASLRERLSAAEAFEQANEIRSHLDAMSTAFQELGEPEASAMRKAIERFGDAGKVGVSIGRATVSPSVRSGSLVPRGLLMLVLLNMSISSLCAYILGDRLFTAQIAIGGWGPIPFLNILTLSVVAAAVLWYAPNVRPVRAGLIGVAIACLHVPASLYFLRHMGFGMLLALPYGYYACVFAVCALSAFLAPRLRQAEAQEQRRPLA